MPQLKVQRIRRDHLDFTYSVYVNINGEFTTTLPSHISEILLYANIELHNNQKGNPGFFIGNTLLELQDKVDEVIEEYFSKETIEEKMVIRYIIQTSCAYCLDVDGNPVPNGGREWTKYDGYEWKNGTIPTDATHYTPYGINLYARPMLKFTYKYKSGKIKSEYETFTSNQSDEMDKPYLHFLNSFVGMSEPNHQDVEEIDYTENSAKFFVDMLISICNINEKIKDMVKPDMLQKVIDSKQKLLS